MAQSNSKDSGLFSILTDFFDDNPKRKRTPSERQDELAKMSPGSKIIRRPNPMEDADGTTYTICETWIRRFQEAVRLYGKNCYVEGGIRCSVYQQWIRKDCGIAVYYPEDIHKNE